MGKRVGVMIQHPEVWEEFREFVKKKWGKKHTAMALELENAIRLYLEVQEKHAHTENHRESPSNPSSKTMKNLYKIVEDISKNYTLEVDQDEVEKVITKVAGGDERTLRKYTWLLQRYGFLKPDRLIRGSNPPKFIYRVVGLEADKIGRVYGV